MKTYRVRRWTVALTVCLVVLSNAYGQEKKVYAEDRALNELLTAFYDQFPQYTNSFIFNMDGPPSTDEEWDAIRKEFENLDNETFYLKFSALNMPEDVNAERIPAFLGSAEDIQEIACEVNIELTVTSAQNIDDGILVNVCDDRSSEIRGLIEKTKLSIAESGMDHLKGRGKNIDSVLRKNTSVEYMPVLILGHGIGVIDTFLAINDSRTVIVQIRNQSGCAPKAELAYCKNLEAGMMAAALSLIDIDYSLEGN